MTTYDRIGIGYAERRRPDPRIAAHIERALGDARRVVNVGAGSGSYEPAGRDVTAVEPSAVMIAQRPPGSAPVVQATAERLPFADAAFDAAMALLTIHHWADLEAGVRELQRVAGRVVILTWDQAVCSRFWLACEYLPQIAAYDAPRAVPIARLRTLIPDCSVTTVPVPHDCTDGFLGAYWRRPEVYLDPGARAAISSLAAVEDESADGLRRLEQDIRGGAWATRHADLLGLDELDLGYRLVAG